MPAHRAVPAGIAFLGWVLATELALADPPRAPGKADDDIVEVIGDDPPPAGAANTAAPAPARDTARAPPASADRFEVNGWARQSIEVGLDSHNGGPAQTSVPYDRGILRTQALMRARWRRNDSFEANVSGLLSYAAFLRGAGSESWSGSDHSLRAHDALEARLYELYFGFYFGHFDLRIGQQRLAWGRAEFVSPNDVVNARDLRDPSWSEAELRHIPTPLVRGDWAASGVTLEAIFSPIFVPDRFDVSGSNWSALQPSAPASYRGLFRLLARAIDSSQQESLNRLLEQTELPRPGLDSFSAGAKLSWSWQGIDFDQYYHYGYDGQPVLSLNPSFAAGLGATDFGQATFASLAPVLQLLDAGIAPFTARYRRRHHAGMDATTTLGPFVLGVDAAYESNRVFYRQDLTGFAGQAVQAVASVEYQTGDVDKLFLLEGLYQRVIDDPRGPLLIYGRDTYGAAFVARFPIVGRFGTEVRGLFGFPRTLLVQPRLDYQSGPLRVSLGLAWLDGARSSFGGYFRRNASAFSALRYSF